jgi:hypothetical protein
MEQVGVAPRRAAAPAAGAAPSRRRRPRAADWPAPWDAAAGILRARGWSWRDKCSLLRAPRAGSARLPLRAALTWRSSRGPDAAGAADLIEPLCVSALNTPPSAPAARCSCACCATALFGRGHGGWGGSNLLLPRQDLGACSRARAGLAAAQGAQVRMGARAQRAAAERRGRSTAKPSTPSCWPARRRGGAPGRGSGVPRRVAGRDAGPGLRGDRHRVRHRRPAPAAADAGLRSGPGAPAQFVFDRGQLGGRPACWPSW